MIESSAPDVAVSVSARLGGKVTFSGSVDGKLALANAQVKPLDQIDTPVTYNTYATDYFAQIYTRD